MAEREEEERTFRATVRDRLTEVLAALARSFGVEQFALLQVSEKRRPRALLFTRPLPFNPAPGALVGIARTFDMPIGRCLCGRLVRWRPQRRAF